ncbi:hypothetical protein Tco_0944042 [Tanacetum coccineum]
MDTTMQILEWNMKAPLEIIYEAYEGEEEDEVNNDNNMVSNDKEIVGCERYPSLSLSYPESDSSWDGDFPMDLHSTRIQELLVYVTASCPFTQSGNKKWALTTSHQRNNKPYVDTSGISKTVVNNTQQYVEKQNTQKIDNTLLPSTRRVSYTNASGSQPKSNTRNDRIQQPSSRSENNKVKAQHRNFKPSSNKNNYVSDCNANVKNLDLSLNSANVCLSCNECLFSTNHDTCVVNYLKDVNKRKKAKSVKQKEKIQWKPTRRVFTTLGHRWVPTRRMFSVARKSCPLTKNTPSTIVPLVTRLQTIRISAVAPNTETRMRYSIAKNSLIRAHTNCYVHPFLKPNFALARNYESPERSS